jgi:histidinol dehydrogenase
VALDLLAQGEHGPGAPVVAVSDQPAFCDALQAQLERLSPQRPASEPAAFVLALAHSLPGALAFAEAFAPEHLELVGAGAEQLAPRVRAAGCVFVGANGATAFGDYVAGSNHCLPTGGSARFASGLSPRHFRRRLSEVHIAAAAPALAAAGVAIAHAEGFDVHAESMAARVRENPPA